MVCRIGGEYDVVKVVDFGLVRSIKSLMPSEPLEALSRHLRGTPAYIAPELLADPLAASVSSDIYSLGVVTYKMLSGRNPFDATHEGALLYDILHAEPQSLAQLRSDLPEKLVNLVTQCLAKDPQARPASVEVIHQELTAITGFSAWTQKEARHWWGLRDHLLIPADS
jgi:serine/threonine-protein kinase